VAAEFDITKQQKNSRAGCGERSVLAMMRWLGIIAATIAVTIGVIDSIVLAV
jgi:hypothetical protein